MSSPSPPSPHRRASPPLPSVQLLPPKKRWTWLSPTAAEAAAAHVPTPPVPVVLSQIHHAPTPATVADVLPSPSSETSSPAAAAGQKLSSSPPPPPLAGDQELHSPPPPPLSAPPPSKRVRKVVRKVRKVVKRLVPMGTTSAAAAAGASQSQAAVGKEALDDEDEKKDPVELIPEKPTANGSNAAAKPALLGEETTAGKVEMTVAGEAELEKKKKPVSSSTVSGREKRMREVFVGGLDVNAKEEDVRAALSEAGEITEVRMIMDVNMPTRKNRGYCFVQFREAEQARKAIAELGGVKICGKECRIQPLEGNGQARAAQRSRNESYTAIYYGENWPTLGDNFSHYISSNSPGRNGIHASYSRPTSSSGALHHAIVGYSPLYHHGSSMYHPDSSYYGLGRLSGIPMRQASSRKPGHPHGSRH